MDYHRIYREFIADRRTREASLLGYVERHHILPRSLGGSDDRANLLRLTPEDHYFAHLLLAKIHGGSQWGGVHCMARMINEASEARSLYAARFMVGVARRRFAEHKSRVMSGNRRETRDQVATLYHDDGRQARGSRAQLAERTGLNLASVSRICNGRQGRSYCGWYADRSKSDAAIQVKRSMGAAKYGNVAGANKRAVVRLQCGTVYDSLTCASAAWATNTSNIARAIRKGGKAAGSLWSYTDADSAATVRHGQAA